MKPTAIMSATVTSDSAPATCTMRGEYVCSSSWSMGRKRDLVPWAPSSGAAFCGNEGMVVCYSCMAMRVEGRSVAALVPEAGVGGNWQQSCLVPLGLFVMSDGRSTYNREADRFARQSYYI